MSLHPGLLFGVGRYIYNKYKEIQKEIEEDMTVEKRRRTTAISVIMSAILLGITYGLASFFHLLNQPSLALFLASLVLWLMVVVIICRMVLMVRLLSDKNSKLALRLLRLNMTGTACLIVVVTFTWFYFPEEFQFGVLLTYMKEMWQWL